MEITLQTRARGKLLAGAEQLANAVRGTLGPKGRNVALYQKPDRQGATYADRAGPGAPVLITNDGATIAQAIVLADPLEDLGAQLLRQVATSTNEAAGDGTTTATVLAQSLLRETSHQEASGANPIALRRGLQKAGRAAVQSLLSCAVCVSSEEDLCRVATISCKDPELGQLVGHALHWAGPEGFVTVDDAQKQETTLELQEGIVLERGFLSSEMATNEDKTEAELWDPCILLCDTKLEHIPDLLPALIVSAEAGRDCLIICEGLQGDARSTVLRTNQQGDIRIVCIEAPLYGDGRRWRMEDLAIQLGAVYFRKDLAMDLRGITLEQMGTAHHVRVTKRQTIFSGPGGNPQQVEQRIGELRYLVSHESYEFNRRRHQERLAQLSAGVAVIHAGGRTQAELWERKMRLEDAVHAARAAQLEGIVPGGGTALLRLIPAVVACAQELCGDEKTGALALARALEAPVWQIAENAGQDGGYIVARLLQEYRTIGYDAAADRFCDLMAHGIIDPVRVTRVALEQAVSVAATILTTEAGITASISERA